MRCIFTSQFWYHFTRDTLFLLLTSFNLPFHLLSHKKTGESYCQSEVKLEASPSSKDLLDFPFALFALGVHYISRVFRARCCVSSYSKSRSYYGRSFYRLSKFPAERRREKEKEKKEDMRVRTQSRSYLPTFSQLYIISPFITRKRS